MVGKVECTGEEQPAAMRGSETLLELLEGLYTGF